MCILWENIKNVFYKLLETEQETITIRELNKMIDDKLNEWIVDTYSKNVYMYIIPEKIKLKQREKIRQSLMEKYKITYY